MPIAELASNVRPTPSPRSLIPTSWRSTTSALQNDDLFVVTELLEGKTLAERLTEGALPVRKAIEIAVAIARGLSAAHGKGIAHRDLKPANVYLLGRWPSENSGFRPRQGCEARTERRDANAGRAHRCRAPCSARLGYMAPEQVRGTAVDVRADLFALGVVLYEMLTGVRAFARDTTAETMTAILKEVAEAQRSASGPAARAQSHRPALPREESS